MKSISNIQVLRGLAAMGVVVAHAAGMLLYGDVPVSLPNVEWGAFGVDVFFVVSGFVMAHSAAGLFGEPGAALPFLLRRAVRVVPLYWMASLAFALLNAPEAGTARELRALAEGTLRSMLFVPAADGGTSLLPTGWTLYAEMAFYLCFACALPFRRRPALLGLGGGLALLGALGAAGCLPPRFGCVANLQALEFVAGLALAEIRLAGWRVPRRLGLAAAWVTFAYVVADAPHMDGWTAWRGLAWGGPAAVIVGGLALWDPARRSPLRRALERLGDASYSVYMVHFPLFWALGLAFGSFPRSGPHAAQLYVVLLVAAALPASFVVHRLVEVPLTRWLGERVRRLADARGDLTADAGQAIGAAAR